MAICPLQNSPMIRLLLILVNKMQNQIHQSVKRIFLHVVTKNHSPLILKVLYNRLIWGIDNYNLLLPTFKIQKGVDATYYSGMQFNLGKIEYSYMHPNSFTISISCTLKILQYLGVLCSIENYMCKFSFSFAARNKVIVIIFI